MAFPSCPPVLKPIQHYMKLASEHDTREPVISYWCRLHALNCGLKIDSKSKESLTFLTSLMDWLEAEKKRQISNESISVEVAGQAHVENHAIQLFSWADEQDRAGIFNKNVVKAFYTAGMLLDVCTVFGTDLSEELENQRKYAKWKAAYIHNCLKNGVSPVPGPKIEENLDLDAETTNDFFGATSNLHVPPGPPVLPSPPQEKVSLSDISVVKPVLDFGMEDMKPPKITDGPILTAEDITKSQKYCKWAASALNYDDVPTAITNLELALRLLKTGRDA